MPKTKHPNFPDSGKVWREFEPALIPSTLKLPEEFMAAMHLAKRILDIGCGACSDTQGIKHAGATWIGMDINATVIAAAKKLQREKASFLVHDARRAFPSMGKVDLFLLKGMLTCLPSRREQIEVLRNVRACAAERRLLVIADFLQNWDIPSQRSRYLAGRRAGLEKGTFVVRYSPDSAPAYLAHHFDLGELNDLVCRAGLKLMSFRITTVRTRSGNEIKGFVASVV